MRTTITLEDGLASELKKQALASGKSFKQVVNEILLAGLQRQTRPRPYRLKPAALGAPAAGVDLAKALQLADELENLALRAKLEQRK
ncbi:DUF2191 domain-containing protein [Sulfuricystis multivorans]|uniref:DUF2191 domain-containing protein n=1 Tax=Sulfuricystis multivorans TaxID=2211108 RepID=UPI000F841E92|nr:DUF2191 domain-containing protein [Sulfuricystis multivorans]